MIVGLDHVQVSAPEGCEPVARAFYGELLGLEEVAKPDVLRHRGGVWFVLPDGRGLHVGVDGAHHPLDRAHPALRVESAEALALLVERLVGARAPVERDVGLPGVARVHTRDPFGNRLELVATTA